MAKDKATSQATGTRKMQKVDSDFAEPFEFTDVGQVLAGTYVGYDDVPVPRRSQNGKSTFRSWRIMQDGAEKPVGIAGSFLDTKMARIPKGTYVEITYIGKTETNNGTGKDFDVQCEAGTKLLDTSVAASNLRGGHGNSGSGGRRNENEDSDLPY